MRKFQFIENKKINRNLLSDNPLFKAVFEDSQEALFFLDAVSFKIVDCNQKAIELFQAEQKIDLINNSALPFMPLSPLNFA
ncbi:MAG: PAS domain-containing protein [Bacteroidales bacterium]|nr:PAS domain-containing protein [Bacteroidales bacterium]